MPHEDARPLETTLVVATATHDEVGAPGANDGGVERAGRARQAVPQYPAPLGARVHVEGHG